MYCGGTNSKNIVSRLKIIVIRQCILSQKWDVFDFLYSKFELPGNSREFSEISRELPEIDSSYQSFFLLTLIYFLYPNETLNSLGVN